MKFWNLKTSECINTVNAHEGKIWALDVSATMNKFETKFITGGTDSKITLWSDVTKTKEKENLEKEEEKLNKEEQLRNLGYGRDYLNAMKLSLEINHKGNFMNSLQRFITNEFNDSISSTEDHISMIINNRKHLEGLDSESNAGPKYDLIMEKILKNKTLRQMIKENLPLVLEIIRDNNVKSSTFMYVQIILKLILLSTNYENFFNKNEDKNEEPNTNNKTGKRRIPTELSENLEIIRLYSGKHLERIDREATKAYLIEYVINKMKLV